MTPSTFVPTIMIDVIALRCMATTMSVRVKVMAEHAMDQRDAETDSA